MPPRAEILFSPYVAIGMSIAARAMNQIACRLIAGVLNEIAGLNEAHRHTTLKNCQREEV